ncbi:MAG TPA: tRNA pseudouridine(55) synthase TruB [Acidimicrobiales bacterium]|nr:tRNA pseudouridine(55) synthase TruB [Acidimicrobiales bacterium]
MVGPLRAGTSQAQVDGVLVLDKPAGCTSHDVVNICRQVFGQKRVGHAGTLDPDATGALVVGLGQATRLLQFLGGATKRYTGVVVLGTSTTTLDSSGEITAEYQMSAVSAEEVASAAGRLTGEIMQVPPMVSALKVGGRRLHELARRGVEVERAPRPVVVSSFGTRVIGATERGPVVAVDVECSAGTYVRSLAADLGRLLGGGAYLRELRRLRSGAFSVEEAVSLEVLRSEAGPARWVVSPAAALRQAGFAEAVAGVELADLVRHGRVLPVEVLRGAGANGPGPWAVTSGVGHLLAVYERYRGDVAKPAAVFEATPGASAGVEGMPG